MYQVFSRLLLYLSSFLESITKPVLRLFIRIMGNEALRHTLCLSVFM